MLLRSKTSFAKKRFERNNKTFEAFSSCSTTHGCFQFERKAFRKAETLFESPMLLRSKTSFAKELFKVALQQQVEKRNMHFYEQCSIRRASRLYCHVGNKNRMGSNPIVHLQDETCTHTLVHTRIMQCIVQCNEGGLTNKTVLWFFFLHWSSSNVR